MERLKRKIDNFLLEWKNNPDRLPLIIKGARQIGKTNAIRNFGENNYKVFIEINFILNPEFKSIFDKSFNVVVYFTPFTNGSYYCFKVVVLNNHIS